MMAVGLTTVTTISCKSTRSQTKSEQVENNLSYNVILDDQLSLIKEQKVYQIKTQNDLANIYGKLNSTRKPGVPVPKIDFDKKAVFAFALGQRNTGGYHVEIKSIEKKGDETTINYKILEPSGMAMQAITTPIYVIDIENSSKKYKLNEVK